MANRPLPSFELLHQYFHYLPHTGELFWLPQTQDMFVSKRAWATWSALNLGKRAGYHSPKGGTTYWCLSLFGVQTYQHRIIWKWMVDEEPYMVDHEDGNGLNNVWGNLRHATKLQNMGNSIGHRNRKHDLPKGVFRNKKAFETRISFEGAIHRLGIYPTPEEAHAAYCEAGRRLHGEFFNPG